MPTSRTAQAVHDLTARNLPTTDLAPELQREVDRDRLMKRRAELKAEFEAGQKMLTELEAKQNDLRSTLLRISGAIQVLDELLTQPEIQD